MAETNTEKWIRRITGSGEKWRIGLRFNEKGSGLFYKLKFLFVIIRAPFVMIMIMPSILGIGFVAWETGSLAFLSGNNITIALLVVLITLGLSAGACVFNEWYGSKKGYDSVYRGQVLSGGARTIEDGILSYNEVLNFFRFWLILALVCFGGVVILTDFNPIVIFIFLVGVFIVGIHDWLKANGLLSLLAYIALGMLPFHLMYVSLTGNFPPLILWFLAFIEGLWAYEQGSFIDLVDYEVDVETNKRSTYVQYGINRAWLINRSISIFGAVLFLALIVMNFFPTVWILRVILWTVGLISWNAIDRNSRDNAIMDIEVPALLGILYFHGSWVMWTFLLILM